MHHGADLEAVLRQRLDAFPRRALTAASSDRHAAVALVMLPDPQGDACLIVTQRSAALRRHGGQWALPGGRLDDGEDVITAARRELAEEVGVELGPGAVCGQLDDFQTRSGFLITPVVLWSDKPQTMIPDPGEVAAAHLLTLDEASRPEAGQTEAIAWSEEPLFALAVLDTWIFAPTAAIIHQFVELAVHGRTTRVAHFEQPRFAWS